MQLGVKRKRGELGRRLDHHLLETERNAELAVDEPYAVEFDDRHGALALLDLVERDRFLLGGVTLGGRRGEHLEFDCVGVTLPGTNDRGVQCLLEGLDGELLSEPLSRVLGDGLDDEIVELGQLRLDEVQQYKILIFTSQKAQQSNCDQR